MSVGSLEDLSRRFRRFAHNHARVSSPLYTTLALGVAADEKILRLAQRASGSPVTNLFFGVIHYLLLSGADHPLRAFYPNLSRDAQPAERAFPLLQSFCSMYEPEIGDLLKSGRTQTNEVRRCLYLALGLDLIAREAGPYGVIDVGSSAGLHLLWPRYRYEYRDYELGDRASPVLLTYRFEGTGRPSLPSAWCEPVHQVGVDLHPLDARNADDQNWLRALVWPEHATRAALLEQALCVARRHPPRVEAGDALVRLPELLREIPADVVWCVCHNQTLNQFVEADRVRFDAMLGELAIGRPLYRLSAEWIGTEKPEFVVSRYFNGAKSSRLLARVDDHGAWIEWTDR